VEVMVGLGWGEGGPGGRAGVNVVVSIDAFQTHFIQGSSSHEKQSNIPSSPHTSPMRRSPSPEVCVI